MGSVSVIVLLFLFNAMRAIACPDSCVCDGTVMRCSRATIPHDIPTLLQEVYLEDIDLDRLSPTTFTNDKWKSVTFLDLHASEGSLLRNETFLGLGNLEHLGIHAFELDYSLEASVFEGLGNVRSLDLGNNSYLTREKLLPTLESTIKSILPALESLMLTRMFFRNYTPIAVDEIFLRAITNGRSMKYLDLSETNINLDLDYDVFQRYFCDTIQQVIFKNGFFSQIRSNFYNSPSCKSVHTLDITDIKLPVFIQLLETFDCRGFSFFGNVKNLFASGIMPSVVETYSFHLDMSGCTFRLQKIVFRKNQLKWLNFTVSLDKSLSESVQELDLSDNIIEFISPESIYASVNIEIFRLSNNRLGVMQKLFPDEFERLLLRSRHLKQIYLDGNNLIDFPKRLFVNNKQLEYVDLSRNGLTTLTFDFMHFENLKYFDVSNNRISAPDVFMSHIDTLNQYNWSAAQNRHLNQTSEDHGDTIRDNFQVKFGSNPFECSCTKDMTKTFEWIKLSPTVYRINETYSCNFQGEAMDILTSDTDKIQIECAHQKLMNVLKVVLPVLVILVVVLSICEIFIRRYHQKKKKYQAFLGDLHNDIIREKFLSFLSFCSEDMGFVMKNISGPLQKSLSELTGNNRNFVCIGDREFRLGLPVHAEVMRCMEESNMVIFVVSKAFCKKDWCKMEVGEAYAQGKPIIMLMKEHVEVKDMSNVMARIFNRYTHAAWVEDDNGGHLEPEINAISKSVILHAMQGKQNKPQEDDMELLLGNWE